MLRPTMLRYVALACCDRLAGALNFIESSPLPGVCSELADIFIILLFNVDLALYCCLGCLKRRNVRQGP